MYLSIYPQAPAALLALPSFGVLVPPKTGTFWSTAAFTLENQGLSVSSTTTRDIDKPDTPTMSTEKGVQNV
jgi:hypothetical protein